jgi:hypothetical protein
MRAFHFKFDQRQNQEMDFRVRMVAGMRVTRLRRIILSAPAAATDRDNPYTNRKPVRKPYYTALHTKKTKIAP